MDDVLIQTISSNGRHHQTLERPEGELGILSLAEGVSPIVDIVAIHGLDGDRESSWKAKNNKMWLKDHDMLPARIKNARILTYGYDVATWGTELHSDLTLHDHAESLITKLVSYRELTRTSDRPIIFIAHSMGGIVLKFALILANQTHEKHHFHHRSLADNTKGILFIGTPHQGTDSVTVAQHLAEICSINTRLNRALRRDLVTYSEMLQDQVSAYTAISGRYTTKFFYEAYGTRLPDGSTPVIVPKYSAVVPGMVNAEVVVLYKDHSGMVKFKSPTDCDFGTVSTTIKLMVREIAEDGLV